MTTRNYTLRADHDHQRMEVIEFYGHSVEITFHHSQDLLVVLRSYRALQSFLWCSMVMLMWNIASCELVQSCIYLNLFARAWSCISLASETAISIWWEIIIPRRLIYISAIEALWRLFKFDITDRALTSVRLDAHLKNHHTVYLCEDQQPSSVRRERPGTRITELIDANKKWPGAPHMKYIDFPIFFIWKKSTKRWTPWAKLMSGPSIAPEIHASQFPSKW